MVRLISFLRGDTVFIEGAFDCASQHLLYCTARVHVPLNAASAHILPTQIVGLEPQKLHARRMYLFRQGLLTLHDEEITISGYDVLDETDRLPELLSSILIQDHRISHERFTIHQGLPSIVPQVSDMRRVAFKGESNELNIFPVADNHTLQLIESHVVDSDVQVRLSELNGSNEVCEALEIKRISRRHQPHLFTIVGDVCNFTLHSFMLMNEATSEVGL
mmetsp:Transcript_27638/g.90024  ORF Transcript_27638/g.90024 Transcript_27638/m.90024 type:complete len:219 (-) Transcript_27638:501-1157(-)